MTKLNFQPGDLLAFAGRGLISNTIKAFTCSRYSHVAGIAHVDRFVLHGDRRFRTLAGTWRSRNLLIESTTLATVPCALTERAIAGVQAHEPQSRVDSYDGAVWHLRLHPDWLLDSQESLRLSHYLIGKVGLEYSARAAALAGGNVLKRWLRNPETFHYVFCSQLWAGALERVGRFPLGNASKVNPGQLIKTLIDDGTYLEPVRIK